MRLRSWMAVFIVGLLVAPTGNALVSEVLELIPQGFPYLGGICGLGTKVLNVALGVNCINGAPGDSDTSCETVTGGKKCEVTMRGEGEAYRWVKAASVTLRLDGSCSNVTSMGWGDLGGVLPVLVHAECPSGSVFIASGSCQTFWIDVSVQAEGPRAPPPFFGGHQEIGICA